MANNQKMTASKVSTARSSFMSNMCLTEQSPFAVQEAYKALRTNLSFSLMDKKIIGITSPQQHDGKSTTALNLAASFAMNGKKVLLIDCDLHLPVLAKNLKVPQEPGFSNFMIREASFSECIRKAKWTEADFMPSGTVPPDASRLLDSPAMDEFLKKLTPRYDLVLLDLPPLSATADAAMLSKHGVEGFLVVVRHEFSDVRAISELIKKMELVNAELLGFIYNDVPIKSKGSYYKDGYGYGYGYGG